MSHVDEGLLHAYVDGAFAPGDAQSAQIETHLAACADCRALLEEARALKERAHVVLRHASPPVVDIPPFDTVRARRPAAPSAPSASRTRSGWLPPVRLAWAASLMLALGAGWMANEIFSGSPPGFRDARLDTLVPAEQQEADQMAASEAESVVIETRADDSADRAGAGNAQGAGARGEAEEALRTKVGMPVPERPVSATAAQQSLAEPPAAPVQRPRLADIAAVRDRADSLAGRDSVRTLEAGRLNKAVGAQARAAAAPPPPAATRSIELNARVVTRNDVIRAQDLSGAGGLDDDALSSVVSLLNDYLAATAAGSWTQETRPSAERRFGRALAVVDDAQAHGSEIAEVDGRVVARTLYNLESAAQVELIQHAAERPAEGRERAQQRYALESRREAALRVVPLHGLEARAPLFQGESVVWLERPGLVLLLRGALSADSLSAIASRVRSNP